MRSVVMVKIPNGIGPYPAVLDTAGELTFNRYTVERMARDSQAGLGMLADIPGEAEYVRLVNETLEFYRLADGPGGEHVEVIHAARPDDVGRYRVPDHAWPWVRVEGSRGQVRECCVSPFGLVCGHQAGL